MSETSMDSKTGADVEEFGGKNICDLSVHMSSPSFLSALVVLVLYDPSRYVINKSASSTLPAGTWLPVCAYRRSVFVSIISVT